jgi:hypothetical protein
MQNLGRNAVPGIRDGNGDEVFLRQAGFDQFLVFRREIARTERDHSAGRHRVAGIDRQVQQRELELGSVHLDGPGLRGRLGAQLDAGGQRLLHQLAHLRRCLHQIDGDRIEHLPVRKSKQVLGQFAPAVGGPQSRPAATSRSMPLNLRSRVRIQAHDAAGC